MHKALHPTLYVSRKMEEEDLPSLKIAYRHQYNDYIEKNEKRQTTAIRNDTDNTMNNRTTITRKQKWKKNKSIVFLKD